jgi:putative ABC transport system permease protein
MSITARLARAQLKQNRKRTILTLLGIVLSVAMITAVLGFAESGRRALRNTLQANENWHIHYYELTPEQAEAIAADYEIESSYTEIDENGTTSLYVRLKAPTGNIWGQFSDITDRAGVEEYSGGINTDLLIAEGHVPDPYAKAIYSIAVGLILIIMCASIIVVSNAFRVSAGERTKQFGTLKSAGATSRQIRSSVLYEAFYLSIIGIPIGLAVGLSVEAIGMYLANVLLRDVNALSVNNNLHFSFTVTSEIVLFSVIISAATVFISAYLPARKAAKLSAIDAIRARGEIKIKAKKVKTSRLTRVLFGFEGELAAKSMKRSRRSYRATVAAIAASVVLFVVGSSFGDILMSAMGVFYPNVSITALATYNSSDAPLSDEQTDELTARFREYEGASVTMIGSVYGVADLSGLINEQGLEAYRRDDGAEMSVSLIEVDDEYYARLCRLSGAKDGEAISLNYLLYRNSENKREIVYPFNDSSKSFTVKIEGREDFSFKLGGNLKDVPADLLQLTDNSSANIVVHRIDMTRVSWLADLPDSAGFEEYAEGVFAETFDGIEDGAERSYDVEDIKAMLAATRGLGTLMMLFIYGFIALLTLIGLTNVISTISTNVRLRRGEFAALISCGMTREGLGRSLRLESVMCGLRALIIGLPLALAASYFLHTSMVDILTLPYEFPIMAVLISVAAVFAVTIVTMRFSAAKLRSSSLVDAMRGLD